LTRCRQVSKTSRFLRSSIEEAFKPWVSLQLGVLLELIGDPLEEILFFAAIRKSKGKGKILKVLLSPCLVKWSSECA
jgi:hypothetical protein